MHLFPGSDMIMGLTFVDDMLACIVPQMTLTLESRRKHRHIKIHG